MRLGEYGFGLHLSATTALLSHRVLEAVVPTVVVARPSHDDPFERSGRGASVMMGEMGVQDTLVDRDSALPWGRPGSCALRRRAIMIEGNHGVDEGGLPNRLARRPACAVSWPG